VAQFQTFDIVVVPFPYSDRLAEKRRPAIVVSSPQLEDLDDVVWVAMITSSDTGSIGAVPLQDMSTTGLNRASFVRPAKLATLETNRILRRVGRLSSNDVANLRRSLKLLAGF
jgi:mRNA interferase MazF